MQLVYNSATSHAINVGGRMYGRVCRVMEGGAAGRRYAQDGASHLE